MKSFLFLRATLALILTLAMAGQAAQAEISIQPYRKAYSWKPEWSQALKEELNKEEYSKESSSLLNIEIDVEDLTELSCTGYNKASMDEKKEFWITFFSALTRAESAFNPKAVSGKSRGHRAYGLLQLARQTAKSRCGMDSKAVFNGEENLKCGIKLIQWQLQGAPTKSGRKLRSDLERQLFGKYIFQWGPLRQNDRSGRKLLVTWFKNHVDQLSFCNRE